MSTTSQPPRTPKIYLLPNLLTGANLACGFTAIFFIFEGMRNSDSGAGPYYLAIGFILGACLFDALDGRVARMKGQESMFGREFDSLADIVSFGMAPALLVMDIVLGGFEDRFGWMIAFIYLVCGAMRLARFNCLSHEGQEATEDEDEATGSKDFVGFPIPAAAGLIASLTVFIFWLNEGDKEIGVWRYVLLLLMLLLSFLMLSEFRYPSFKTFNWRTRRSVIWVFAMILLLVSAVAFWKVVPFFIFLSYLAYGCVRPFISRKLQREIEAEDDDDDDPESFGPGLVEVKDSKDDESAA